MDTNHPATAGPNVANVDISKISSNDIGDGSGGSGGFNNACDVNDLHRLGSAAAAPG